MDEEVGKIINSKTTGHSIEFTCYLQPEIADCAAGITGHGNWIIETVKKNNGWKTLTKKRKEQLFIHAYWLGRNGKKPEATPYSWMSLLPKMKNTELKK